MYRLTKQQLLEDLYTAFEDARRHKRSKPYVLAFARHLEENLQELCDTLWNRTYRPRRSTCFIITDPKKREVFAADFRDRVVHHLYYNYTHELFERTFIEDTYSCIPRRGTHYGINRLQRHIRQVSRNYTRQAYVLKMDIRGYFMHINRKRLFDQSLATIRKMAAHRVLKHLPLKWEDKIDIPFIEYLTEQITLLDPLSNGRMIGDRSEWNGLAHDKSLFHSPQGFGLPIGNLTSQLYSNVYLNVLDQYMKRTLHCKYYGRYVDDFYVVSPDKEWLHSIVKPVKQFLQDELDLALHDGKMQVIPIQYGVPFLGMYVKPRRLTASRASLKRMRRKKRVLSYQLQNVQIPLLRVANAVASFRGMLSHGYNSTSLMEFEL